MVATASRRNWHLDNFGAGIDRRDGLISREQNRFWELTNYFVSKGKKLRRRPPAIKVSGSFGAGTYGLVESDGVKMTFALRGAAPTTPTGVSLVPFDAPAGSSAHVLVDVDHLNDTLLALFSHTIGGVAQYFLHVFDDAPDLPTYTQDPEFPWLHYVGDLPRAVLAIAANKVCLSGPQGNTYRSGVARPRTWWTRQLVDVLSRGYEFHFYAGAAGSASYTVPLDATLIGSLQSGFVAWVVERYTGSGTAIADYATDANWATRLEQVAAAPTSNQCVFSTTTNTSIGATYANWISVTINASAAGWYRVRFLPPQSPDLPALNYVDSGCINITTIGDGYTFTSVRGDGVASVFDLDPLQFNYVDVEEQWGIAVDGVDLTWTTDFVLSNPQGHDVRVTFTAPPADGALVTFRLVMVESTHKVVIPPGIIRTWGGIKAWKGGFVTTPTTDGTWYVLINLDANSNPSDCSLTSDPLTGKMLYENVVVLRIVINTGAIPEIFAPQVMAYNGKLNGAPVLIATHPTYIYRNVPLDEKLYDQATLDVGATENTTDAGMIPTASHDHSGGAITALVGTKNRLLIYYVGSSQLWAVNENGKLDRILDSSDIGSGSQSTPFGEIFAGAVMMASVTGPRIVSLVGQLTDTLDDTDIEESIERLGLPLIAAAASWPLLSLYVAACTIGGEFGFLVFSYSKESKIAAWSQWDLAGVESVDYKAMIAQNDRLYFRSGDSLYYFDSAVYTAAAPSFRDTNDDAGDGNAYRSRAVWNFNDFERPGSAKRFLFFDLVQTAFGLDAATGQPFKGASSLSFKVLAADPNQTLGADDPVGTTVGLQREGLSMTADAVAPIIESTDENGHEIQRLSLDFKYLRR